MDNIWTTKVCPTMQYCDVITNPRWRTDAILKSINRHISVKNHPSLMKFGTHTADSEPDESHEQKLF